MAFRLVAAIIGVSFMVFGTLSLTMNFFVLLILWRGGLLQARPTNSTIYIFAFASICGNCIQVAVIAFYLGPICVLQTYLFDGGITGFGNHFISYIQLGQWYQDMQITAVIAINRLVGIVFKNDRIFSRTVVKTLSIMVFFTGYLLAIVPHKVLPCCIPYFKYEVYWMAFVNNGTNFVDDIIDIPQNSTSSLISIVCYTTIFIYYKMHNTKKNKIAISAAEARRNREIRLAFQFAALSGFILFAWVGFRIFPLIVPTSINEIKSSVTFAVIIHCSANSIIFLTINKEVKSCLRRLSKNGFFWRKNNASNIHVHIMP